MSDGIETVEIVDPWLYETLTGAGMGLPQGNIINGATDVLLLAPPYVVFSLSSELDLTVVGGARVWADCIYLVKAVVRGGNYNPARDLFKIADAALGEPDGTTKTHTTPTGHISCTRQGIIQYPEVVDGAQYRHLGATYRIKANSL